MNDTLKILKENGFCTEEQFQGFRIMLDKINHGEEIVLGWHGTRASIAKKIKTEGFKNYRCKEGAYGVYFADIDNLELAKEFAIEKCKEQGEDEYALIKAEIIHPNPDLLMGRAQWLGQAHNVNIIETKYFKIKDEKR